MNKLSLRDVCFKSKRLKLLDETDYIAFKKELGAIELNGLENYFITLLRAGIKVKNESNSLVAYIIGLTDIKPNKSVIYKGGTLPDIDIDFADTQREKVIQYVVQKYGPEYVAGIGTYSYLWAKSAIATTGKALGHDLELIKTINKMVPELKQGKNWHIDECLKESQELKAFYDSDPRVREILDWATKLDGGISAKSQHAAGIVISADPIHQICPVWKNDSDFPVIEFTMEEVEKFGLVKMDFLGLRTLSIIDDTLKTIKKRHNIDIKESDIPLDDSKTFELFETGKLLGIFQLEGDGISNYTVRFKPQNLMDITLISAGYRPGPMQFMEDVSRIRHGNHYKDVIPTGQEFPIIAKVLNETYGYFIYQEQIQRVVEVLAGYNDHEADDFRKTIAKKLPEKMIKEKERFTVKALESGMSEEQINKLWAQMEDFAAYCFNKSHALAYSILTVKTAWLKTHYPVEFYAANILHEMHSQEKVTEFIIEAKERGINILPPDINESEPVFAVINDTTIRFGLGGIANMGLGTAEQIIEERNKNGKFKSVTDFIIRTNIRSNILVNMIKGGCFDSLVSRAQLLYQIEKGEPPIYYIDHSLDLIRYFIDKELIKFDTDEEWLSLPVTPEYSKLQLAEMEKSMNGMYLGHQPLQILSKEIEYLREKSKNKEIYAGYPSNLKIFQSQKGFSFDLNAGEGNIYKVLCVGKSWEEFQNKLPEKNERNTYIHELMNDILYVETRMSWKKNSDNDENLLFAQTIQPLLKKIKNYTENVYVAIPLHPVNITTIKHLSSTLNPQGKKKLYAKLTGQHFSAHYLLGFIN